MKDEELDKTKPIDISEIEPEVKSRAEKYEDVSEPEETRVEKYENNLKVEEEKELEEAAEEALAEKNIAMAEEIEQEEKAAEESEEEKENEENEEKEEPKKEKLFTRIKNWWSELDKSQKIIYGVVGALFLILLILIIIVIVSLFAKSKPKQEEKKAPAEEVAAPVMFDNYYYQDGSLFFLDEGRAEVGSYECENKDETLCFVAVNKYRDTFDVPRVVDESGNDKDEKLRIINNNFVFIFDNASKDSKTVKLYSMRDKEVKGVYNEVKLFDDNFAIVADENSKYGLLRLGEAVETIIAPSYDYLGMISGQENLIAKNNKGFIVINKSNKSLSSVIPANNEIKNYNENFVVTKVNGNYSIYNYKAEELDKEHYFATVMGKYYAFVDNKRLYVRDIDKIKYNEDGVDLNSTHYVKTFVYDENGSLVETKKSFEIQEQNGELNIALYEDGNKDAAYVQLNIAEAMVNKKYQYLNYFDGKLFFYRDDVKTDLIGSYKCNNRNDVNSPDNVYTTCAIATDTVFEDNDMMQYQEEERKSTIPMMNEKFVFIKDGGNSVVLYDIVSGSIRSTYSSVDSYTPNNDYVFTSTSGRFDITAFNKKGKYGVIRIDGDNVSTLYVFNYNKIEKLGKYFEGQDTTGKWLIFMNNKTDGVFGNKIQGYSPDMKYVKTGSAGKYTVHSIGGTAIGNNTYAYVELYNGFFAAVDNSGKLKIYDYTGKALTKEGLDIPSKDYCRALNNAFIVNKKGEDFVVSVFENGSYIDHTLKTKDEEPEPEEPEEPENPDEPDNPGEDDKDKDKE